MKDMEEARYVLGTKIIKDCAKRLSVLSQEFYIKKMLRALSHAWLQANEHDQKRYEPKFWCPETPEEKKNVLKYLTLIFS